MVRDPLVLKDGDGLYFPIPLDLTYPDGMPLLKTQSPDSFDGEVTATLRPKTLHQFMTALFYLQRFEEPLHLILPMMPGSRQDRVQEAGDVLFTLQSCVDVMGALLHPDTIITVVDPHSDVTPALLRSKFRKVRVVSVSTIFQLFGCALFNVMGAVIAPDAGAAKRAGCVARILGVPLIQASKTRDPSTGKIISYSVDVSSVKPEHQVLVVDDICDGGATFEILAESITREGLTPSLYVTHGIFSKGLSGLSRYKAIFSTDSFLHDQPTYNIPFSDPIAHWADGRVNTLPICSFLAEK